MNDQMNNFYISGHVREIKPINDKMKKLVVEFSQTGKLPEFGRAEIVTFQALSTIKEADDVAVWGRFTWNTFQKKDGTEGSSMQLMATKVVNCGTENHEVKEPKKQWVKKEIVEDAIPF